MPVEKISIIEFKRRLSQHFETIRSLGSEEFFNRQERDYHAVYGEIAKTLHGIEIDQFAFKRLLDNHSGPDAWLPEDPAALSNMDFSEIHARFIVNVAGERWAAGALVKAFESGSLQQALVRLIED